MKLLVITGNPIRYGISNFDYLLDELKNLVELNIWTEAGDINEILRRINKPDFILINEYEEGFTPRITGLENLSIPWGVYLNDLQFEVNSRKKRIEEFNIKYIFSRYRDRFYEWYPQFFDRLIWLPQHVNNEVFKDYGLKKKIDYLLIGWVDEKKHPLRKKMIETMSGKDGFVSQVYPCSDIWTEERTRLREAMMLAHTINRAKIFLTCDSICRYPLATYFEVLACNTLLMAPISCELKDLGFVDGMHFIAIDEYTNIAEQAKYYLAHEKERKLIASQGREMVNQLHTTKIRAQQLYHLIIKSIQPVFP